MTRNHAETAPRPPPPEEERSAGAGADFATLWNGLGLEGAGIAFDATIRPETIAASTALAPAAPRHAAGISLATLPRLSIDLRRGEASGVTPALDDSDIVITGVLGEGGMGRVFAARQRSLARDVAVKTIHDHLAGTPLADALVSEGLITGHLEHPNITPVHQLGLDGERRPMLVMKRIAGVPWRELLDDPDHPRWASIAPLSAGRLKAHLEILMQVCNGMSYAHSRSVVHRDIKPDNVMIGEFGEVYICDWGIAAKLPLSPGSGLVGTPSYLAPEMLDPKGEVGPRTDVYLLGGTLHTILTGRPRHEGEEIKEVLERAFESRPVAYAAGVPRELGELANRATSHDPEKRPASAAAFREAIAIYFSHETSRSLGDAAAARLAEMEGKGASGAGSQAAIAAISECRYGFRQALREWPENVAAAEGLERCLRAQLRIEIATENLEGARAVLADMSAPPAELDEQVKDLARRLAERAAAASRLEVMRREEDLSLGARQRTMLLFVLLGIGALTALTMTSRKILGLPEDDGLFVRFVPSSVMLVSSAVGFGLGRKQLLVNRVNRRITGVFFLAMSLELVHRVEGWLRGEPLQLVLQGDMVLVAAATGAAAFFLSRRWFVPSAVFLIASLGAALMPRITLPLFIMSHLGILVFMAFAWSLDRKD